MNHGRDTSATTNGHLGQAAGSSTAKSISALREAVASVYLGNPAGINRLIVCLLARGHCLIEDVPGVGKTLLAMSLARALDCTFSRIQLTPDLLPSDILGVGIYRRESADFEFKRGPIFANIVLADEINRATPRTQTALLEAMNDGSVTVDGHSHPLGQPFMLVATQNPSDFEGTYALPENQLDRFLMRIALGYPSRADEARVLDLRPAQGALPTLRPVLAAADVLALQSQTDRVKLDRTLIEYIIALAAATRSADELHLGLSPRGALALAQAARATAVIAERDYVIPEDITENIAAVCAHRVIVRSADRAENATRVLERITQRVASPA
ncbi:MAG: AAA family ATPase [Phycisphaerales bacterium]